MEQKRIYSPNQAAVGAFIGGPLASIIFIKYNFKILDNPAGESKTLLYGSAIALALLGILPFLPKSFPNMIIPLITILATRAIVGKYQVTKQAVANSSSLGFQSGWRVFLLSLAAMAASLIVIGAVLFALDAFGIIKLA